MYGLVYHKPKTNEQVYNPLTMKLDLCLFEEKEQVKILHKIEKKRLGKSREIYIVAVNSQGYVVDWWE